MVFVASLMLLVFHDLLCLIAIFFMCSVWPYHFVCGVVLLLVFMGFFLDFLGSFLLCFEGLGDWLGNEES